VSSIGDVFTGKTPSTSNKNFWNGNIPFITPADINKTKYVYRTERHVTLSGAEQSRILPKNTVLIVCIGSTIGKIALTDKDSVTNQQINSIICNKDSVEPEFVYYSILFRSSLLKSFSGIAAVPIVKKSLFEQFKVPIPPVSEQKAIIQVLGIVDSAIELADTVIAKTERLKKGLMQQLLTRGIGHTEYKETKLGKIPRDWLVKRIGDVCKVVTGGTPSTQHPEYFGGNVKWLKSGDIKKLYMYDTEEKITQLGIEKSNAKIHPACSVAIALSGRGQTRGRTTVLKEPMACSQSVAIMILNSELKPEYLHYNLSNRYMEIRNLTGNLDRSGLNLSIVSDIQIPVPSIAEQEEIALVLITVDKRIELEKEEKMRLGHIRQGLMDLLLNGKIRIKVD